VEYDVVEPVEISSSIVWLAHLIDRFANTRLAQGNFPPGMSFARANLLFAVHAAIQNETSSRMVDIAMDLGVTARTLTTMVDALEKQELVGRVPDPNDRRAIQLEITDAGRQLLEPLAQSLDTACETVMAPLDERERRLLMGLLTRLIERDTDDA
jgi:DNA-binding MarR family transcriptional regulator